MDDRGNERDDRIGGLGLGGAQGGDIGGDDSRQRDGTGDGGGGQGEGQQRHSGGSSRDSENLK